jgi:hypothetical protein
MAGSVAFRTSHRRCDPFPIHFGSGAESPLPTTFPRSRLKAGGRFSARQWARAADTSARQTPHACPATEDGFGGAALVDIYYLKHRGDILLGMSFCAWHGVLDTASRVQLSEQMRRREKMHVLSQLQLCGGILTGWLLVMCAAFWFWCVRFAGPPPESIRN